MKDDDFAIFLKGLPEKYEDDPIPFEALEEIYKYVEEKIKAHELDFYTEFKGFEIDAKRR